MVSSIYCAKVGFSVFLIFFACQELVCRVIHNFAGDFKLSRIFDIPYCRVSK